MPIDLYYMMLSPPCRAVMLTAKAVGVELNLKETNLFKKEHMKPEFLALNPQHCIPTMVDGDFVIWESKAACSYLASKYGKDDSLFPNDPRARAVVERLNYFDMGTLFHRFGQYVFPALFRGEELDPTKIEPIQEALGWLDGFLAGHKYAAGDNITIADHTLLTTVITIKKANIDLSKHTNILAWLERCKTDVPGYDMNEQGAEEWAKFFKSQTGQS
uniref:Glutathione S-transferase n=1 Tax=Eriocheir sinensis TaxID=95602 RepID=E0WBN2_ERISI|nr:glutathione S-transferase [Eriocheir sinensis]